jgi:glycosyltransferase involved in cell wall biosynthesis
MRIAIDGNEANVTNRVGSNVYAFKLISTIYEMTAESDDEFTILLSTPAIEELPQPRPNWHYQVVTPKPFWTQWALPIHLFLNQDKYDCLFTPGHYAPRLSSIPYISSVMDLGFIHFPDQFRKKDLWQLTNWTKYSVKRAKHIITISQASKLDIINQYHLNPDKISIAYPGQDRLPKVTDQVETKNFKKFNINKPYLLYVGTLQPRKNINTLISAFEKLKLKLPISRGRKKIDQLQLVLAGKKGWLTEPILERIEQSPFKKDIILTGFVSELEKHTLLKNAAALNLIGLYEGFGIPALEAMQWGTIPIVSNVSSLPEVVDHAGFQVDPTNIEEIAQTLEEVLMMTTRNKAKIRTQMRNQLKKFEWRDSAQVILDELHKLEYEKK